MSQKCEELAVSISGPVLLQLRTIAASQRTDVQSQEEHARLFEHLVGVLRSVAINEDMICSNTPPTLE
jgi:hypothetical protein